MTLRVGDERERHSGNGDRLLHDASAQASRVGDGAGHVLDADEERDEVVIALKR
jgi:hypothetical protein